MSFQNQKIRVAVVGCGHIGKRHASMVVGNPNCELAALCDVRDANSLKINEFEGVPFFSSLEKMLADGPEFDIVAIATPNGLHEEQALRCLDARKHIILEKPMALTKAGCERIIHKALNFGKQVFCVMQNRYSSPSVWLKEMVENKTLGQIFQVQINCWWNRDERYYKADNWHGSIDLDGGTLFTQFSHFIDIMYWVFGDIKDITARFADFNHQQLTDFEDSGSVSFQFINGGMGCLNYSTSCWDKNLESSITVIAENGFVKVGGQYMNEVEICHIKNYEMPTLAPVNPPNNYGEYKGSAANHHFIYENIVDVLRGDGAITTNALEGLKVVEIIERIYRLKPQNGVLKKQAVLSNNII